MAAEYREQVKSFAGQMRGTSTTLPVPRTGEEADEGTSPKLSPVSQGYRPSNHCEVCHFYCPSEMEDAGTCQIVSGSIDGDWICNSFRPKDADAGRPPGTTLAIW